MRLPSTRRNVARASLRALIIGLFAAGTGDAWADPTSNPFAAGALVAATGECDVLTVSFNREARYAGHVPKDVGGALTIQLNPVDTFVFDPTARITPQGVAVENAGAGGVKSVTVEFNQPSGPTLRIEFDRKVTFDVAQPGSLDQIAVAFPKSGSKAACSVAQLLKAPTPTAGPIGIAQAASPLPVQRPGAVSPADVNIIQASLDDARYAMRRKDYKRAIVLLKKILEYPESASTPDALLTLGETADLAGDLGLAAGAYREYLRRYPFADAAAKAARRLGVEPPARAGGVVTREPDKAGGTQWSVGGGVSSFYVRDDSATQTKDISTAPNPNADPDSHIVHQNEILNNFDLRGSISDELISTKIRVSGSHEQALASGAQEQDRVGMSTAYFETYLKPTGITARVGRQSVSGAGVIGRFDGALLSWQYDPTFRFNVVGGAANWSSYDAPFLNERYLFGTSVDVAGVAPGLDASLFAIQQNDRGVVDRRAVGAEVRYYRDNMSALGLIDYDIHFQKLNAATFTGSYTFEDKSILATTLDYRRVPYLSSWNALEGQPYATLYDMLHDSTLSQVQQYALDRTPVFTSAMVSYMRPLNERWQVGGDGTITHLAGTPPSGGVDGTMPSGTELYLSGQLVGTSIVKDGDQFVGALRYAHLNDSNVYFLDLGARYPWDEKLSISPRFRAGYRVGTTIPLKETTILPSVLLDYAFARGLSFEGEVGYKYIDSLQSGVKSASKDFFFTLGVRSDFSGEGRAKCSGWLAPCAGLWLAGGGDDKRADLEPIYFDRAAPPADAAPSVASTVSIEGGMRYWLSVGSNKYDFFADSTPTQLVSRLDYRSGATHAGEAFFRADIRQGALRDFFLKGMAGGGLISSGRLYDEDFPPITDPYSKTVSAMSGRLGYWGFDVGYNVYTSARFRLGAFIGFQQMIQTQTASGCQQLAQSPICAGVGAVPTSVPVVTEWDRWNSLRVGAVADVNVTDKLKWRSEVALLSAGQNALDTHYFTFGGDPSRGRGGGFQAESAIDYRLTKKLSVGAGVRWWRYNTDALDSFGQMLRYRTDRYGVFGEASYRLN